MFFGDDILEGFQTTEIYRKFEEMHLLNFSIRRDLVENVLWRISSGELENIKPKIIVLHCGTNNISNRADEVAEGILEIIKEIRKKHPETFIVLPTLLPRGHLPNKLREKNEKINDTLKEKVNAMYKIQVVDIDKGLVQVDGSISHHDLHDYLNLSNACAKKLFEPVSDLLNQILNEIDGKIEELTTPSE